MQLKEIILEIILEIVLEIVPETRPSLKGNVIDLATGPENYVIPRPGVGIAYKNAHLQIGNVTVPDGKPVEVVEIR